MLRNPISFILKLGKRQSLPFRPLTKLSPLAEGPSPLPPTSLATPDAAVNIGQSRRSNQMSS